MVVCWLVSIQHQLTSIQRETHADEQCVEDVWGNMQNPLVVHYHPVQRCAKKRAGGRVLFPCQQMLADNDEMVLTATRWGCQAQFHDNATCLISSLQLAPRLPWGYRPLVTFLPSEERPWYSESVAYGPLSTINAAFYGMNNYDTIGAMTVLDDTSYEAFATVPGPSPRLSPSLGRNRGKALTIPGP